MINKIRGRRIYLVLQADHEEINLILYSNETGVNSAGLYLLSTTAIGRDGPFCRGGTGCQWPR